MAPPQTTQRAADALLDGPTMATGRALSRKKAGVNLSGTAAAAAAKRTATSRGSNSTSSCSSGGRDNMGNPYMRPSSTAPTNDNKGGGSRRKRPLGTFRGRNGSCAVASSSAAGVGVGGNCFDRRNSRDVISKRDAPMTGTDRNLLAMLDQSGRPKGGRKKKSQRGGGGIVRGNIHGAKDSKSDNIQTKRPRIGMGEGEEGGVSGLIVPPPPPMPSYGHGGLKVRRRFSSVHRSSVETERGRGDGGGVRGCSVGGAGAVSNNTKARARGGDLDEKSQSESTRETTSSDVSNGGGKRWMRDGPPDPLCPGDVEPKSCEPDACVWRDATGRADRETTAITAAVPATASTVATFEESLEASSPTDDELMALPLGLTLGVGQSSKAATKRGRASGGGCGTGGSRSRAKRAGKAVGKFGGSVTSKESRARPSVGVATNAAATDGGEDHDERESGELSAPRLPPEGDAVIEDDGKPLTGNETSAFDEGVNVSTYDEGAMEENDGLRNAPAQRADWYDSEEDAAMQEEVTHDDTESDSGKSKKRGGGGRRKKKADVNENFVRLDLRNAAGSCRGARNLKKTNKAKLWRATHMFGMRGGVEGGGDGKSSGFDDEGMGNIYSQEKSSRRYGEGSSASSAGGGDLKSFAVARHGGVDPLDDFVDGVFVAPAEGGASQESVAGAQKEQQHKRASGAPKQLSGKAPSDGGKPTCTRHQRPCKLLTVKHNKKGNKGRKFYVCSMPRGEQCDYFKWEEDTVEATQRALLKSSSSSGFIARQVAASRTRFKELTLPELREEAKKRGLKWTGKKEQILTRLLIWIRDEIADSVEPDKEDELKVPQEKDEGECDKECDEGEENCLNNTENDDVGNTSKFIELSDDSDDDDDDDGSDESDYSDNDEGGDCSDDDGDSSLIEPKNCNQVNGRRPTAVMPAESTLHESLTKYFGYTTFREGQEWAIRRCLAQRKTLLVAPTGQGKSLCYALPAAIMEGICIVVSPLISLMQDQLRQLPPKIPAATLSGSITTAQMALIVDDVMKGRYKVLFVSPERLASAAFRRLVRPKFNVVTREYERQFPTVSLLCVDEAHCLSQWGHNFRPSYLRVRSLLPLIEPKSVLALTATAGPMVVRDICNTLCIPHDGLHSPGNAASPLPAPSLGVSAVSGENERNSNDGVKVLNCDRDNIDVFSVILQSNDERRYLLHKILMEKKGDSEKSKKLPIEEGCLSKGSVIVYVWRQKDTEIVAEQLNGAGIRGGVVCYHGGMDAGARNRAQSKFMRGKSRICVATVAFGLGINKPDIKGVIHLCLPPSPEHYLQETGRAGRDGRPAIAIALPLAEEYTNRHSLSHSDRMATSQLEVIFLELQRLVDEALSDIPPEAGINLEDDALFIDDIHVAMPVMRTVDSTDCKEESIETILSLLEESSPSDSQLLHVEGYLPDAATITLKRRSIEKLEKMEQIASSILKCGVRVDGHHENTNEEGANSHKRFQGDFGGTAMQKGFYAYSFGTYKFSVVRCARCMGPNIEPRHVYAALRRLQQLGEIELVLDTTSNGRAMHLRIARDGINTFRRKVAASNDQIQEAYNIDGPVRALVTKFSKQFAAKEKASVGKVKSMHDIIQQVSRMKDTEGPTNDDNDAVLDEGGDDDDSMRILPSKKSNRLLLFQRLVQSYFRDGDIPGDAPNQSSGIIKNFPLQNMRLLMCLSSDVSSLMQVLAQRRQEQMPMAVRIEDPSFADYRDLCIAKILHSIDAPRAPILDWYSHPLWGKYRTYSFSSVVQAVKKSFEVV